jgi:hypothetical protein
VAHALLSGLGVHETDDYAVFKMRSDDIGGLLINSVMVDGAGTGVFTVYAEGGTAVDTQTTGGVGLIDFLASEHDGSNALTTVTANGNVFSVRARASSSNDTKFIVDQAGELHAVNATVAAFDREDDVALVRSLDHRKEEAGMKGIIRRKWDAYIRYNEQDLVDAEILGDTIENGGMLNVTGMQRLHSGAIWQLFEDVMSVAEALPDEARQKLSPRIQNALQGAS